jgi:hypothetical protein
MEMLKYYNMERFCNINQYILDKNTIYHLEQEMLILVHCLTYGGFQPMSPATASLGVYFPTPM